MSGQTITISDEECAVVIGSQGESLVVRIESSPEPEPAAGEEPGEVPIPKLLGVAIATRLTEDPDFVEEMLDWFDEYTENEDAE